MSTSVRQWEPHRIAKDLEELGLADDSFALLFDTYTAIAEELLGRRLQHPTDTRNPGLLTDAEEQELAVQVCHWTGMTPDKWDRLRVATRLDPHWEKTMAMRRPWLEHAVHKMRATMEPLYDDAAKAVEVEMATLQRVVRKPEKTAKRGRKPKQHRHPTELRVLEMIAAGATTAAIKAACREPLAEYVKGHPAKHGEKRNTPDKVIKKLKQDYNRKQNAGRGRGTK